MIRSRILALALVVAGIAAASPVAAVAQDTPARADARVTSPVSLTYFMDRLSLFGRWYRNPKWGVVWQPDAGPTFRPYFFGYWQDTEEYGWFWVSSEPYGDIVYHYGRWVFDPQAGWLWVPGYVWGPSWVVWRGSENAIGWMPMPPGYADYESGGGPPQAASDASYRYEGLYGSTFAATAFYDLWAFVAPEDFGLSRRRRYVIDHDALKADMRRSHDETSYRDEHGYVADRSLEDMRQTLPMPQPARRFLRNNAPVTTIAEGQDIFRQERANAATVQLPKVPPANPDAARAILGRTFHGATPLEPPSLSFGFNPPTVPPPPADAPQYIPPRRGGAFDRLRGVGVPPVGPHTEDYIGGQAYFLRPHPHNPAFYPPQFGAPPPPISMPSLPSSPPISQAIPSAPAPGLPKSGAVGGGPRNTPFGVPGRF